MRAAMFLFLLQIAGGPGATTFERAAAVASSPEDRVNPRPQIAPGPPPVLSFRYYEGSEHGRFSGSDLVLDDAGH